MHARGFSRSVSSGDEIEHEFERAVSDRVGSKMGRVTADLTLCGRLVCVCFGW